ncbi:MAG: zinc ribbon domain-containing protein [Acidobacteriota bacterium]
MEQPCFRCGYVSDRPARFCRQCGSQLVAETEASSAATRNYAQLTAQNADPQSTSPAHAPYQQWDDQTPETTPFYRPPNAPQYQTPIVEQKRTNWGKWVVIGLLTFMMFCIIAVGGVIYLGKQWVDNQTASPATNVPDGIPPPPSAPAAPGAPSVPAVAGSLDSYKYPDAEVTESHKDGINEMVQMTTDDDIEDVREYYQKKFKKAMSINDGGSKKVIFTSMSQPLITVILQPDEQHEDKTQILLTRVNIAIPNIPSRQ